MKLTILSGVTLICNSLMIQGCGSTPEESTNSGPSVDDDETVPTADEKTKSPPPSKSGEDDSTPDTPADSVGEEDDDSAEATEESETGSEEVGEEETGEAETDGDEVGEEETGAEEDTGPPPEEPCGGLGQKCCEAPEEQCESGLLPFLIPTSGEDVCECEIGCIVNECDAGEEPGHCSNFFDGGEPFCYNATDFPLAMNMPENDCVEGEPCTTDSGATENTVCRVFLPAPGQMVKRCVSQCEPEPSGCPESQICVPDIVQGAIVTFDFSQPHCVQAP